MKSHYCLYLLFGLITLSCTVNGQITEAKKVEPRKIIGKSDGVGHFAELSYQVEDDTTFLLMYRNVRYSIVDIESVSFKGGMEVVNILYSHMTSVFSEENKKNKDYEVEFTLGDTLVSISSEKALGIIYMKFWTSDGYFHLTDKQVKKLFGK